MGQRLKTTVNGKWLSSFDWFCEVQIGFAAGFHLLMRTISRISLLSLSAELIYTHCNDSEACHSQIQSFLRTFSTQYCETTMTGQL